MKQLSLLLLSVCFAINVYGDNLKEVHKGQESYKNINSVVVEGDFCKVVVNESPGKSLMVTETIKASKQIDGFAVEHQINDNTLQLTVVTPDEHVSTKSGEIALQVPPGSNLDIKTRSGYIEFKNARECNVKAKASYGQISGENISGNYDLETSTGIISLKEVNGNINAKSSSGDIELSKIEGNLDLVSNKGNLITDQVKGAITTQTNTGNQNLKNGEGDLKLRTSTGEIKLSNINGHLETNNDDGDLNIENFEGTMDLRALSGNLVGTGILFTGNSSFETTKGRVDMEMENQKNELSYDLESNYGFLYIPGKSKKKRLKKGNGPIQITGRSNNGVQRFTLNE